MKHRILAYFLTLGAFFSLATPQQAFSARICGIGYIDSFEHYAYINDDVTRDAVRIHIDPTGFNWSYPSDWKTYWYWNSDQEMPITSFSAERKTQSTWAASLDELRRTLLSAMHARTPVRIESASNASSGCNTTMTNFNGAIVTTKPSYIQPK